MARPSRAARVIERVFRALDIDLMPGSARSEPSQRRENGPIVGREPIGISAQSVRTQLAIAGAVAAKRHTPVGSCLPNAPADSIESMPPGVRTLLKPSGRPSPATTLRATLRLPTPAAKQVDIVESVHISLAPNSPIAKYQARIAAATPTRVAAVSAKSGTRSEPMRLPHPRVRVIADAGIASMALTRRKVRALNDASFVKERRVLSASAGIPTEQLEWIAMYKLVPLAATQNLEVDERKGLLRILLRKDAAAVLSRQRSPVVTLAVGRDKNTGSIVQALIP